MFHNMLYLESYDQMLYLVDEFLLNSRESSIRSLKIQEPGQSFALQLEV